MMTFKKHHRLLMAAVLTFLFCVAHHPPHAGAIPLENEPKHDGALKLLKKSEYDKVISIEREMLEKNPGDLTAYFLLTIAYLGKDDEKMAAAQAENVKKIDGEFASEIYGAMGRFYITRRRYHKSLVYLRKSLEIRQDTTVMKHIASIYLGQGNLESAKEYYRKLLDHDPDYLNLSRIYLAQKDYGNALLYAEKAIRHDPGSPGAYLVAGTGYLLTGKSDLSRRNFMTLKRLSPEFYPSDYFLGLIELIEGNYNDALAFFKDFTAHTPNLGEPYLNIAIAQHLKGELTEARLSALTGMRLDPLDPAGHFVLGNIYLSEMDYENADIEYSRAGELFAEFYKPAFSTEEYFSTADEAVPHALTLSVLYIRAGLYDNAVTVLENLITETGTENPLLGIFRARAEAKRGNINTAMVILSSIAKARPGMVTPHAELAGLHEQGGELEKAIAEYRKAVALTPALPGLRISLGDLYMKDGDIDRAMGEYRRAIAASPQSVAGYERLSEALFEKGDLEKALAVAQKGSSVNPEDNSMKDTLGWIYFNLARYGEALASYRDVVRKGTKDPVVYYRLGMVYREMDRGKEAIDVFEKALNINDEFPGAIKTKEMLNELSEAG